jgi:hypothetical protein
MAAGSSSRARTAIAVLGVLAGVAIILALLWAFSLPPFQRCPTSLPAGESCVSGKTYFSTPWNVPYCGPGGPITFHGITFAYFYAGCLSPGGDTLIINGTEPSGAVEQVSFDDGLNQHAPVVDVISADGTFGFQWQVGTPEVTLLVAT